MDAREEYSNRASMCTISLVNSPSNLLFTDFLSQRLWFCLLLTLDGLFSSLSLSPLPSVFTVSCKLTQCCVTRDFFVLLTLHLQISFDPKYFLYCENECSFHVHLLQLMCFYIINLSVPCWSGFFYIVKSLGLCETTSMRALHVDDGTSSVSS